MSNCSSLVKNVNLKSDIFQQFEILVVVSDKQMLSQYSSVILLFIVFLF